MITSNHASSAALNASKMLAVEASAGSISIIEYSPRCEYKCHDQFSVSIKQTFDRSHLANHLAISNEE